MEKQSKYLIIALVILVICVGIFLYQYNNDVPTVMIINQTEVPENGSVSGQLLDAYGQGVANQTITYHQPGKDSANTTTDDDGIFIIKNIKNFPEKGEDNYYGDFTFEGEDKYLGCTYGSNLTLI